MSFSRLRIPTELIVALLVAALGLTAATVLELPGTAPLRSALPIMVVAVLQLAFVTVLALLRDRTVGAADTDLSLPLEADDHPEGLS